MALYFDKDGQPIHLLEWAALQNDVGYVVIKQEDIGDFWVSTVWLGLGFGRTPLIFETMVFHHGESDIACHRYPTEDEARAGHDKIVAELKQSFTEIETLTNGSEVTDGGNGDKTV